MKCKAVRCIYYNAGNGYTVASYVTEETLPKEVSSQKNGRYGREFDGVNFIFCTR